MRIALLEDDAAQAEAMQEWLEGAGYVCVHYPDASGFLRGFRRESFDLAILDWELPVSSGIEVLRWVRDNADWPIPIVFVTARDTERDIVQALEQGADDYITKPLSPQVALARIRALGRRVGAELPENGVLVSDWFRVDCGAGVVEQDGQRIDLTEKECRLALMLLNNIGRLLSRDHLLERVWGVQSKITTRTVDTHMSRLRQKLGLLPEKGWRLKAVYHHGYRLERLAEPPHP